MLDMPKSTTRFRSITPLFNFSYWTANGDGFTRGGSFEHKGRFSEADYSIRIIELSGMEFKDERRIIAGLESLYRIPTDYYLVVDTMQLATAVESNTRELVDLRTSVLNALHVHTRGGLQVAGTIELRNPQRYGGEYLASSSLGAGQPNIWLFNHSSLNDAQHGDMIGSFELFLNEPWGGSQFERVLGIAMDSLRLHGYSGKDEHAFLLLMIAFEAMFKSKNENSDRAAKRLAELLTTTSKRQMRDISSLFTKATGFRDLRNEIAHGDEPDELVGSAVSMLRKLIQESIHALLKQYASSSPANGEDYYEWLEHRVRAHFDSLPNKE